MRRVVVTGLGAVSPLGSGVDPAWARLLAGRSGLRGLPDWAASLPAKIAGIVPDKDVDPEGGFDPDLVVPVKDQRKMDRFILFALVAAAEAIAQAGWAPATAQELERTATVIASGIGGFPAIVDAVRTTDQRGVRRLSPFTVLPRQPRGRPYLYPSWLQGTDRHAGDSMCRRGAGYRRCSASHSRRRSRCRGVRWS
jgi:3-oxoacyl-[acyl-carrier-protein] synthase II